MTKNEYLIELAMELQKIDAGNMLAPDIKQAIVFYQEMIDDMMEDGKTEEEAVASMESVKDIAERMRREFILPSDKRTTAPQVPPEPPVPPVRPAPPARTSADGRLKSTGSADGDYTRMKHTADPDAISEIVVSDEDNSVRLVSGSELSVEYSENETDTYAVSLSDGVLCVKYKKEKRFSLRNVLGMFRGRKEFRIVVPETWRGSVCISSTNAQVTAENVDLECLTLQTTNGSVNVRKARLAKELGAKTSNSAITLNEITAPGADIRTTNGRISAENMRIFGQCRLGTSNGRIEAADISAEGVGISTANGRINVRAITAYAIKLVTSNGSIGGSVCGRREDYRISSRTSNGKNSLGSTDSGARTLDVSTSNAGIDIDFEG